VAKIQGTEDYSPVLRTVEFRNSRTRLEMQAAEDENNDVWGSDDNIRS